MFLPTTMYFLPVHTYINDNKLCCVLYVNNDSMYVGTYFYNMGIRLFQYFIKLTLFKKKFVHTSLERNITNNVYRLIVSCGGQVPPHFLMSSQSQYIFYSLLTCLLQCTIDIMIQQVGRYLLSLNHHVLRLV